jgi:hypothetical protein
MKGGVSYIHEYELSAAQIASAVAIYDPVRDGTPLTTLSPARAKMQPELVFFQVVGGDVRFSLAGQTPTASTGFKLSDGGSFQEAISPSEIKIIAASGTPVVTVSLGVRGNL